MSQQHRSSSDDAKLSRRAWLRRGVGTGFIGPLGLSLPQLLAADRTQAGTIKRDATFGRAKSVIFLWLQGGPPQHETFDPKPDAPAEIRGPFEPIATNVPGIQFSELLPRIARRADKLAVIRSLHTDDNNHDVSGYWVLTGNPYGPGSARQIKPTDWPYFGSLVKMLKPSDRLPALSTVWLPDLMRLNENVTPAGQTAGFLGKLWEPERFIGDPAVPNYNAEGFTSPADVTESRINERRSLLESLQRGFDRAGRGGETEVWNRLNEQAFALITSGEARQAFRLDREPAALRERYGRHSWGQSVLLARRLVEAGVRLVHVNWPREPGDNAVDNPLWDTHSKNADRLQDFLCPMFDVGFTTLLDDLEERGLLDETLVVAVGEFGRTPKINKNAGRDHWGAVFSCVLAGAGISGGQVYGASDRNGAYPTVDPTRPHDLTATIFHLLGIDGDAMFRDRTDRPHPICKGKPLAKLIGLQPATTERCSPGGDLHFLPAYDARLLLDADFRSAAPLVPVTPASRTPGWRASPLGDETKKSPLRVERTTGDAPTMRLGLKIESDAASISAGSRAVLAQEIRNARGGHYTFTVRATGRGTSAEYFDAIFRKHFACRLVLFRYADADKNPLRIEELADETFAPTFTSAGGEAQSFTVSRYLGSTVPNVNFPIGNGLGVAVVVQRTSSGTLTGKQLGRGEAYLELAQVSLEFSPKQRDETVTT
jgi:hypothetical protein